MKIMLIRHYGFPFQSNENAVLLASGCIHHLILLKIQQ